MIDEDSSNAEVLPTAQEVFQHDFIEFRRLQHNVFDRPPSLNQAFTQALDLFQLELLGRAKIYGEHGAMNPGLFMNLYQAQITLEYTTAVSNARWAAERRLNDLLRKRVEDRSYLLKVLDGWAALITPPTNTSFEAFQKEYVDAVDILRRSTKGISTAPEEAERVPPSGLSDAQISSDMAAMNAWLNGQQGYIRIFEEIDQANGFQEQGELYQRYERVLVKEQNGERSDVEAKTKAVAEVFPVIDKVEYLFAERLEELTRELTSVTKKTENELSMWRHMQEQELFNRSRSQWAAELGIEASEAGPSSLQDSVPVMSSGEMMRVYGLMQLEIDHKIQELEQLDMHKRSSLKLLHEQWAQIRTSILDIQMTFLEAAMLLPLKASSQVMSTEALPHSDVAKPIEVTPQEKEALLEHLNKKLGELKSSWSDSQENALTNDERNALLAWEETLREPGVSFDDLVDKKTQEIYDESAKWAATAIETFLRAKPGLEQEIEKFLESRLETESEADYQEKSDLEKKIESLLKQKPELEVTKDTIYTDMARSLTEDPKVVRVLNQYVLCDIEQNLSPKIQKMEGEGQGMQMAEAVAVEINKLQQELLRKVTKDTQKRFEKTVKWSREIAPFQQELDKNIADSLSSIKIDFDALQKSRNDRANNGRLSEDTQVKIVAGLEERLRNLIDLNHLSINDHKRKRPESPDGENDARAAIEARLNCYVEPVQFGEENNRIRGTPFHRKPNGAVLFHQTGTDAPAVVEVSLQHLSALSRNNIALVTDNNVTQLVSFSYNANLYRQHIETSERTSDTNQTQGDSSSQKKVARKR